MAKETWDNWTAGIVWMGVMVADVFILTLTGTVPPVVSAVLMVLSLSYTLYVAKRLGLLGSLRLFFRWKTLGWVLLGLVSIYLVMALGIFVLFLEHGEYVTPANQQAIEARQEPAYLMFISAVCHAPIFEEVMMRGILMGRLFQRHLLLGLLVSSFIFGFLHGPTDAGSWIIYGGMGLVQGLLYWKTKSLETVIAVHVLLNSIGFLGLLGLF